jgi:alpha-beta hydrolase superfamily lysophospholipase
MLRRLARFALVSALAYVAIALALVAWPAPTGSAPGEASRQLAGEIGRYTSVQPAPPSFFEARDGARRLYRLYQGSGPDLLVLLHGSASDGRYLAGLARSLAFDAGLTVATLDMRGHGAEPVTRGDVDSVDRQERDIADLVAALAKAKPHRHFILAGHSIGGGLAIRYAAGREEPRPARVVLLAPYIHRNAPSARPGSGGWAVPTVTRFAGLDMLHRIGVHVFDGLPVLRFEVPSAARDGTETPTYSWRLFTSVTPRQDWQRDIAAIAAPVLVLAAQNDPIFMSEGYAGVFRTQPRAEVAVLPGLDHFQLATSPDVPRRIADWLKRQP